MKRLSVFLILVVLALPTTAGAQSLYDAGYEAWRDRHFQKAYEALLEFRREPYGRRPAVDFMLGTSACRISGRQGWGYNVLDWMLYAYALILDSRFKVAQERDICRQVATAANVGADIAEIVEERAAGMTGFGKVFYWAAQERQPVASYPIRRKRDVAREEFLSRLVPLGEESRAAAQARKLMPGARVVVHGPFVLASRAGHSEQDLTAIGQTLTRYLRFLDERYGIWPPGDYLSVYLLNDPYAVHDLADTLHGLDVSQATIGYTFVDDLSIVAAVPGNGAGTVLHELFHLLGRRGFGDIPQWLDEGIAAMYEVAGRDGDRYFGISNWRGRVLKDLWNERPTVERLIRTEWFLFDDPSQQRSVAEANRHLEMYFETHEGREQAAMMAMARYFLIYLDERGELAPVYNAIRDQDFGETKGSARDRVVNIVEATLGRSVAALDAEFVTWFREGGPDRNRRPATEGGELFVATANVHIRRGPGPGYESLMIIDSGAKVAVFGEKGEWREVRLRDGTTGYISGRYLAPAAPR
jgi:hypothetical protein